MLRNKPDPEGLWIFEDQGMSRFFFEVDGGWEMAELIGAPNDNLDTIERYVRLIKKDGGPPLVTGFKGSEGKAFFIDLARHQKAQNRLPDRAEFLLYLFLSKKDSEAVAGDLEERWRKIKKKFGNGRANFWYWTQVIRSIGPFAWAAMKRVSGLLALLEMWRKLRG
jgi:hypothetical protein